MFVGPLAPMTGPGVSARRTSRDAMPSSRSWASSSSSPSRSVAGDPGLTSTSSIVRSGEAGLNLVAPILVGDPAVGAPVAAGAVRP